MMDSTASPPQFDPRLAEVTVVVVVYNSAHCMAALADALARFPYVLIVDNASDDGSPELVPAALPQATLIRNERNLGFGAANNLALRSTRTRYAFLLNPDCKVNPDDVAALVSVADEYPDAAIVAPRLLRESGEPEINYRWPTTRWRSRGQGADALCCVGFVCGAAMLFNLPAMTSVGFFDEDFFLYYEDDDLCTRVFQARKAILLEPAVALVHASRGSVRGRHPWRSEYLRGYHHAQSKVRFAAKYEGFEAAKHLRKKVLVAAWLTFPLRLLVPAPRQIARLAGRVAGLWQLDVRALPARK